jgi:hypothetical protein
MNQLLQRACDAENQAEYNSSNGPPRAQGKKFVPRNLFRVFCDVGHTSVAGDMLVSR